MILQSKTRYWLLMAFFLVLHDFSLSAQNSSLLSSTKMDRDSILTVVLNAVPQSGPRILLAALSATASGGTGQGYTYFWDFDLVDGIQIDGIGAEGYEISPAIYGVSMSVSFNTGVIEAQSTTQAVGRTKKASQLGAKGPQGRVGILNQRAK